MITGTAIEHGRLIGTSANNITVIEPVALFALADYR